MTEDPPSRMRVHNQPGQQRGYVPNASKTFFTKAILLLYLGNWKRRLCADLR